MEKYRIIYEGGQGEIVEKKSRFIADVAPVHSEAEAAAFIENIKKKYWDARHHCYAFKYGENQPISRCSDDGEPSGTAGKPVLDVITGEGLYDVCIVVTRYFGGTLLGTGGLVRAYKDAAKAGIENCMVTEKTAGSKLKIGMDYNYVGKFQHFLSTSDAKLIGSEYTDKVEFRVVIEREKADGFSKALVELTAGKVEILSEGECYFGTPGGNFVFF